MSEEKKLKQFSMDGGKTWIDIGEPYILPKSETAVLIGKDAEVKGIIELPEEHAGKVAAIRVDGVVYTKDDKA